MDFFRKIKGFLLLILFPALLFLMGNAAFNWHVHQMEDGSKIVHAHPFDKSGTPSNPGTTHHHSNSSYSSIQQLTGFIFVLVKAIFLALLFGVVSHKLSFYNYHVKLSSQLLMMPNRAPPFLG